MVLKAPKVHGRGFGGVWGGGGGGRGDLSSGREGSEPAINLGEQLLEAGLV